MSGGDDDGQLSLFSAEHLVDDPEERPRATPSEPPEGTVTDLPEAARKRHFVVFDLETKNTFDDVGGRAHMDKLEVSVGVTYNSRTDTYTTYMEDEQGKLVEELRTADMVVGYNIIGFDYPVLQKYTEHDLYELPTFDIMLGIEHTLGYRTSLDKVASATLGVGKSGHGLQAIEWYRNGQWELLIRYCRQDVKVTKDVYEFGLQNQHIFIPAAGSRRRIDVKFDL